MQSPSIHSGLMICAALGALAACGGSANEPATTPAEQTLQPPPPEEQPAAEAEPAPEPASAEEDVAAAEPAAEEEPAPEPAEADWDLVSDFEGAVEANLGHGWEVSTDAMNKGRSKASMKLAEGGAEESSGSLQITGKVRKTKKGYPFAGAMWWPGSGPMEPAKFEDQSEISFWAKGDGREYKLNLYYHGKGFEPVEKTFKGESEWKRYTFSLEEEDGRDASNLMGVFFGAGEPPGKFRLQIDQVQVR